MGIFFSNPPPPPPQQPLVIQSSVPGQPGNEGFKTKEGAEKVAKLVIKKMKKGVMPPSIDIEELKKLKII